MRTDTNLIIMYSAVFAAALTSVSAIHLFGDPTGADADADEFADMSEFSIRYNLSSLADSRIPTKTCLRESPPPLIVVSLGRSGSTAISDIIGSFMHVTDLSHELVGATGKEQEDFFQKDGKQRILEYLCRMQHDHPNDRFVGFKWKPMFVDDEKYLDAWRTLAENGAKFVYNTRNALDQYISFLRHGAKPELSSHCKKGDEECIQAHSMPIHIPVETVREKLAKMAAKDRHIVKLLGLAKSFVSCTMESLMSNNATAKVAAWNRIFAYLGHPVGDLTAESIDQSISTNRSSPVTQSSQVTNYVQVVEALRGTEFEWLLH